MASDVASDSSSTSTTTSDPKPEPDLRTDHLPVVVSEFSILDYLYSWQAYVPMLMLMAAAPLMEAYVTIMVIVHWLMALDGWPTELPPINWTAWVLRLPHIGVSLIFARRLVIGYVRAKEKRVKDEMEGVQKSRHV